MARGILLGGDNVTTGLLDEININASDLRNGKTAINKNGELITGTMPESAARTYTPGTSNQIIAAGQYLAGAQTIRGDANLAAANILYGKSLFGVTGSVKARKEISGVATSSNTQIGFASSGQTIWEYYVIIPTGMTPTHISIVGGSSMSRYPNGGINFVGQKWFGYMELSSGGAYVNSTNARLPVESANETVWYTVSGY